MRQVAVVVEGQTEAQFVTDVLFPWLKVRGVAVTPVIVKTSRPAGRAAHRGGGGWAGYDRDIRGLLKASHFALVTTLIDFYGYPRDAPGAKCCQGQHNPLECADFRETEMARAVDNSRFLPNVVLHEFETWVMAAAGIVGDLLGDRAAAEKLDRAIVRVGGDVELVDDGPTTAPSKRVLDAMPGYIKAVDGVAAIQQAGLAVVLDKCKRLRSWAERMCDAEHANGSR